MKVNDFKRIIKECVREVLREELADAPKQEIKENIHFTSDQVKSSNKAHLAHLFNSLPKIGGNSTAGLSPVNTTGNVFLDILNETAATMTPQEIAQMRQQT